MNDNYKNIMIFIPLGKLMIVVEISVRFEIIKLYHHL